MRTPCIHLVLLSSLLGLFLPGPGQALGAKGPQIHMERLDLSRLPELRAYLTYVDADGSPITGKTASDFKLGQDNIEPVVPDALSTFDQAKEPMSLIGVVQLSPAMTSVLDDAKRGLKQIAQALSGMPGSKMGLLGYAAEVKRLCDNPVSGAEIEGTIGKMAIDPEGTEVHMLDAMRVAIDLLRAQKEGSRKLIVVFTDGIDQTFEKKAYTEIGKRAEEAGIVIDFIGYNSFEPGKMKFLPELTRSSRGTEHPCKTNTDISARFANIVDEIQKQYVATYKLRLCGDDKEHTFQVLHEAGTTPIYSDILTRVLPSSASCTAPQKTSSGHTPGLGWLWALIIGGPLTIGLLAFLLLRNRAAAPPPLPISNQPPVGYQPPPVGNAGRTIVIGGTPTGELQSAWIVWTNGAGADKDRSFNLSKPRNVIGRAPECDIVVDDKSRPGTVSSRHCEIVRGPDGYVLSDLGSANGVVVNSKRVQRHVLIDNDMFSLGPCQFRFKSL